MSKKQKQKKDLANKLKQLEEENFKIRLAAKKLLGLAEAKVLAMHAELTWARETFGNSPEYSAYRHRTREEK